MRTYTGQTGINHVAADTNHPYGKMKNDTAQGAQDGTQLMEKTLGDTYQAEVEILRKAGITPDENEEYKKNSQIADAVFKMQPVMIALNNFSSLPAGYSTIKLNGYTFTCLEVSAASGIIIYKLTIQKDSVTTGNYYVQPTITNAINLESTIYAVHSNGTTPSANRYFANDYVSGNIIIKAPSSTDEQLRTIDFLLIIYEAS